MLSQWRFSFCYGRSINAVVDTDLFQVGTCKPNTHDINLTSNLGLGLFKNGTFAANMDWTASHSPTGNPMAELQAFTVTGQVPNKVPMRLSLCRYYRPLFFSRRIAAGAAD
jgi:hypothetical protein